jgi:hypothetical protein
MPGSWSSLPFHFKDRLQGVFQVFRVKRLDHVEVGLMYVGALDVGHFRRAGIDHHYHLCQPQILLDFLEAFKAVLAGHIKIEKKKLGNLYGKKFHKLGPVPYNSKNAGIIYLLKGLSEVIGVILVVIRQYNVFKIRCDLSH